MNKINIIVVDDHEIVIKGLKLYFQDNESLCIVSQAANGIEALVEIEKHKPDVVITDISMPSMNGIELTKLITDKYPRVNVLVFSMHNDDEYVMDALTAGAMGYIPKDSDEHEIKKAIINVSKGKMYFSTSLSEILAKKLLVKEDSKNVKKELTERELEVLDLIVKGYSNKEIATLLSVSKRTIDNHRTNLMYKIDAKNTADVVRIALTNKYVKIENNRKK
ncbi:MAG: response regulator transcription factor [Vicingaceae bacterium]|jgi:two-component system response regulator NreC